MAASTLHLLSETFKNFKCSNTASYSYNNG